MNTDEAWQEHIAQLRAQEIADRMRISVPEVRAMWAAEVKGKLLPPATPEPSLASAFEIESEMRGETIHYIEPARRTSMMFFWTQGYEIHADTIKTWVSTADGARTPVTDDEREQVIRRVVEWAKHVQGVTLQVMR